MANSMRGEATLKIGEESYTLTMDADALAMAEEVAGKPISIVIALFDSGAHLGMTSALAWAALFREYGFPWEGFRERVMQWGIPLVKDAVAKSMRHAWPEPEADDKPNPPKRGRTKTTAGTGSSS
ncbi:MAG: hypothetical protein QM605_13480 [Sphingobium sp.]